MEANEIEFKTPPAQPQRNWFVIADKLRSRPGEWALVAETVNPTIARHIKRGELGGMTVGQFEARTHRTSAGRGQGKVDIYARYTGPAETT